MGFSRRALCPPTLGFFFFGVCVCVGVDEFYIYRVKFKLTLNNVTPFNIF